MMDDTRRWDKDFPTHWERVPLKSKFSFGKGLSIKKTDLTEEGENVISYGQIHAKWNSKVHCHNELIRHVPKAFCDGNDSSIATRNGFIFADTSEDLEGVGNCAFIDSDEKIYAGYHTVLLTPIEKHDNKYLAYLFTTDAWRYQIRKNLTEVKVFSISQKTLKQTFIVLPPSDIQSSIASFLDRKCAAIDNSIAKHKAIIEKLEEYRKAEITRAVTKGLNPDAKMKDSGIPWVGNIPETWATPRIKECASFHNGDRSSNYPSGDDILDSGIPFLTSDNLWSDVVDITRDNSKYISREKYESLHGVKIQPNDIVYCLRGSIGKCAINQSLTEGTVASSLVVIRPFDNVLPNFLYYLLQSNVVNQQNINYMNGSCAANLSAESVRNYSIIRPEISEQKKIVDHLNHVSASISEAVNKHNQLIAKLEEYKKSLIYNSVTGKIDCREGA